MQALTNVFVAAITALNPLLLLVVGYVLNHGLDQNKAEIEKNKAEVERATREIINLKTTAETSSIVLQQRVDKVKVISDFLEVLSGADERKRKLAIEAILIALPDEAPRLVMVVGEFGREGGQTKDATAARDALDAVRAKLVADMFASERPPRVTALTTLRRSWSDDPALLTGLLKEANKVIAGFNARGVKADEPGNAGLYNVVVYLTDMRVPSDAGLRQQVRDYLAAVQNVGSDNTKKLAIDTSNRFR